MLVASSCHKFLEEDPAGFISPDKYYATEGQVQAAVNGTYAGLDDIFSTGIGVANSPCFMLEYLTGYSTRLRGSGLEDNSSCGSIMSTLPTISWRTGGRRSIIRWRIAIVLLII